MAVLGAGPAGLTAGYALARDAEPVVVFEADTQVGGLARTVERDGYRFDLGGHRFFTKSDEVQRLWHEILGRRAAAALAPVADLLARAVHRLPAATRGRRAQGRPAGARALRHVVPRRGRAPAAARGGDLRAVGLRALRAAPVRAVLRRLHREGLGRAGLGDPRRVGRAAHPHAVVLAGRASGGAQRRRRGPQPHRAVPLPAPGPRPDVGGDGGRDRRRRRRAAARPRGSRASSSRTGGCAPCTRAASVLEVEHVISSLPLRDVVAIADPPPPSAVLAAARGLRYRDFLTVALVVRGDDLFPDNWIYVHDPEVRVGRIQNFRAWSEAMVPDADRTCVGLEYFCFEGDELWNASDDELVARATGELARIGLADAERVRPGTSCASRRPIRSTTSTTTSACGSSATGSRGSRNLQQIGRNGLHRYNNSDHSMLTALRAVENACFGCEHDLWAVNSDGEYHEERAAARAALPPRARDARAARGARRGDGGAAQRGRRATRRGCRGSCARSDEAARGRRAAYRARRRTRPSASAGAPKLHDARQRNLELPRERRAHEDVARREPAAAEQLARARPRARARAGGRASRRCARSSSSRAAARRRGPEAARPSRRAGRAQRAATSARRSRPSASSRARPTPPSTPASAPAGAMKRGRPGKPRAAMTATIAIHASAPASEREHAHGAPGARRPRPTRRGRRASSASGASAAASGSVQARASTSSTALRPGCRRPARRAPRRRSSRRPRPAGPGRTTAPERRPRPRRPGRAARARARHSHSP